MITINVIKVNEVEYLTGKLEKKVTRILKDLRDVLLTLKVQQSTTVVEANEVLADALIAVDTVKSVSNNALTEILKDDLQS
jgi:hypothetical protein